MRFAWPLTGRAEEMRVIDAALSDPELSGIVICGAAGVGKSRIAREALRSAASNGYETRWAVGTSSARALPLGAFASWAESVGAENLQLVHHVIESLTAAPRGTAVIVGVDDAQLLDDLSTFVVHQIVQRQAAKVVLTIRDGDPVPAGTQEIWTRGQFNRLDLQPLSRDEITALVASTLGGSMDPGVAQRLWKLTRGNPLYLKNIVENEVDEGRLSREHGHWMWGGDPVMPPGLIEMIESRIGSLPDAVGEVVDALAVGEPIELASLARITDSAAVEDADRRGLISLDQVDDRVEVRVAHPLYGEVRRKRAPATRLRRLRGLVAAELAPYDGDIRTVLRRAALGVESDVEPDPALLVRAAKGAVWLANLPLAERLATVAVRAGAGPQANVVRAQALSWLSRGREAEAVFAEIPIAELSDVHQGQVVFLRAHNLLFLLADPAGAKKLIDDAAQVVAAGAARKCIDAFLTEYWAAMGKSEVARDTSKEFVLGQLPGFVGGVTAWAVAAASGDTGRTSEAIVAAETGYDLVRRSFDAGYMRFVIADAHVGALLQAGKVREAADAADRLHELSADLPGAAHVLRNGVVGRAALGAGRLDTVCSVLEPVGQLFFAAGNASGFGYRYELARVTALAMQGATDDAVSALGTLEKHRHPGWRLVDYEFLLTRAWVAAAQGAVSEATDMARSAAENARANGQFAAEVVCLQTAAQFGDGSCSPRLDELAKAVEGPRVRIAARFASAVHAGDGVELASVSEEFEQMGDLMAAVDAAAHAAIAYRQQGLRGSAYGSATRAVGLAERCGGASTPALGRVVEPLPLTSREREIVRLIGEGLSNRDIAERLSLSVRTIEGHIYRAMAKTEADSRDALAALLPRRRSGPE